MEQQQWCRCRFKKSMVSFQLLLFQAADMMEYNEKVRQETGRHLSVFFSFVGALCIAKPPGLHSLQFVCGRRRLHSLVCSPGDWWLDADGCAPQSSPTVRTLQMCIALLSMASWPQPGPGQSSMKIQLELWNRTQTADWTVQSRSKVDQNPMHLTRFEASRRMDKSKQVACLCAQTNRCLAAWLARNKCRCCGCGLA